MTWKFKGEYKIYDEAYLDGYRVDRLLENVTFKITIDEEHKFHVELADPMDMAYCHKLNMPYFYETLTEYCKRNDIFDNFEGDDDLAVYDTETGEEFPNIE